MYFILSQLAIPLPTFAHLNIELADSLLRACRQLPLLRLLSERQRCALRLGRPDLRRRSFFKQATNLPFRPSNLQNFSNVQNIFRKFMQNTSETSGIRVFRPNAAFHDADSSNLVFICTHLKALTCASRTYKNNGITTTILLSSRLRILPKESQKFITKL